jgi:hypothetical protein
MNFTLFEQMPNLAAELTRLLSKDGEQELAGSVSSLMIVERCRCGDDFCATMYTVAPPRDGWGRRHRNVVLHPETGHLIIDILDQEIVGIEVLFRDEGRERLLELLP